MYLSFKCPVSLCRAWFMEDMQGVQDVLPHIVCEFNGPYEVRSQAPELHVVCYNDASVHLCIDKTSVCASTPSADILKPHPASVASSAMAAGSCYPSPGAESVAHHISVRCFHCPDH